MNGGRKVNLESLRQRAEQVLHEVSEGLESRLSVPTMAIHELVHELHVYQAELELQNEELQESQARLLRSSAKYQTLFHSMPLPAVLCDDRGFVVEANVAAQKLLGVNSFIVEQRYALSQFISLGSRSVVDSMLNSPASGPVQARICNIRTRVEIPCQLFFQALCDQTPDCFSQILIVDRTSEVELERARLDAEAASRAKSTFLAKMSHELRTPFNGVLGMIELARRRMTDPQGLLRLDAADHSARQLLGIVDEILDLARVESGRLKLEQVPFSIGTVLDDVVAMHEPASEEKGLRLKIVADDMGMVSVIGDPGRFQQVISNLVGNAIKFSTAGGIRIFVRREREEQAHIWVRTEVHDDGIGISEEAQRRIFSPFEQADNSTTRKHGGTGLGLAICKQLVELAGGTIGVVSNRGEGCQFWFTMPFECPPRANEAPASLPVVAAESAETVLRQAFAGSCILLAEDEAVNQEVVQELLKDAGLVVEIAGDGASALALSKARPFSLILMDMQMPVMDGLETTKAIRADSMNRKTPILAFTANAFDEDRERCLIAGMNGHLPKPVVPDTLFYAVLKHLQTEPGFSE